MTLVLTRQMVRAAAQDAGNRSMRRAGRSTWDAMDWNAAVAELDRLTLALPSPVSLQPEAYVLSAVRNDCLSGRDGCQ